MGITGQSIVTCHVSSDMTPLPPFSDNVRICHLYVDVGLFIFTYTNPSINLEFKGPQGGHNILLRKKLHLVNYISLARLNMYKTFRAGMYLAL